MKTLCIIALVLTSSGCAVLKQAVTPTDYPGTKHASTKKSSSLHYRNVTVDRYHLKEAWLVGAK